VRVSHRELSSSIVSFDSFGDRMMSFGRPGLASFSVEGSSPPLRVRKRWCSSLPFETTPM